MYSQWWKMTVKITDKKFYNWNWTWIWPLFAILICLISEFSDCKSYLSIDEEKPDWSELSKHFLPLSDQKQAEFLQTHLLYSLESSLQNLIHSEWFSLLFEHVQLESSISHFCETWVTVSDITDVVPNELIIENSLNLLVVVIQLVDVVVVDVVVAVLVSWQSSWSSSFHWQ